MVASDTFSDVAEQLERLDLSGHNSGDNVERTLGEILATVRGLDRQQQATARSVERAVDALTRDMSSVKHEMRNAQQITQGKLEIMQNEHQQLKQRLTALEETVFALKKPVDELVNLRRRMGAMGMLVISVGTVAWAIIAPVWTAFAEHWWRVLK
jgi:ABC-type transporter Mla subunit MlaD